MSETEDSMKWKALIIAIATTVAGVAAFALVPSTWD
jgi:hypothetical protein